MRLMNTPNNFNCFYIEQDAFVSNRNTSLTRVNNLKITIGVLSCS